MTTYLNRWRNEQKIYRFPNGYGASVIRFPGDKTWELAVIKFIDKNKDDYKIVYDTKITNDVIEDLTNKDLLLILKRIKNLRPPTKSFGDKLLYGN